MTSHFQKAISELSAVALALDEATDIREIAGLLLLLRTAANNYRALDKPKRADDEAEL